MNPGLKDKAQALKTFLENSEKLTFLEGVYLGRDTVQLMTDDTVDYPFLNINIDPDILTTEQADNVRDYDMVRNVFGFSLQYCVKAETEEEALFGTEDTDGAIITYGILDIIDALYDALSDDETLSGAVQGMQITNTKSQVFSPEPDRLFYTAGANTTVKFWKDEWMR
jgi:hypothetical protein